MGQQTSKSPDPSMGGKMASGQPQYGQPSIIDGQSQGSMPQPIPSISPTVSTPQSNFSNTISPTQWDNSHVGTDSPFGKGSGGKNSGISGGSDSSGKGGSTPDPVTQQTMPVNTINQGVWSEGRH